jgi:hypothetical protein
MTTVAVDTSKTKEKNTSVVVEKVTEEEGGNIEKEENWLNQVIHNE